MFKIKMENKLKQMYSDAEVKIELKKRKRKCLKQVAIVLLCGAIFMMGSVFYDGKNDASITEIKRGDHLKDGQEVELLMEAQDGEVYDINIRVDSMQYQTEVVRELYRQFFNEIEKTVLGKNKDWNLVTSDLNFVDGLLGYPFEISWETSDYRFLSKNGERIIENICENDIEESVEVSVTATVRYLDFERKIYYFPALSLSDEEKHDAYARGAEKEISDAERESRDEEMFCFPEEIMGEKVSFKRVDETSYFETILLFVMVILALLYLQRLQVNRELNERKKELEKMYPEVVSKLALLLCAGFTIRNAWEKMVFDYEKKDERYFVFEQMKKTELEIKNGQSEGRAYESFGVACFHQKYRKLGNLLSQNLKRGNKNIVQRMKEESKMAYLDRRENALLASGKAETKMLVPMLLLMMIVLVVVIIPVFMKM